MLEVLVADGAEGMTDCHHTVDGKPERRIEWCAPADAQEPTWLILFDDPDRSPKVFSGAGAEEAAHRAWAEASQAWNCHLLCTVRYTGQGLPWEDAKP